MSDEQTPLDPDSPEAHQSRGRRTSPDPLPSEPTWDCRRAAEHVAGCPGCEAALRALVHDRVVAILTALGTDTAIHH